jgi:universal stress protein E
MRPVRRILVAIKDCEAKSPPALVKAAQMAKAFGAQLELFHGISTPLYVDGYNLAGAELPQVEHTHRTRVLTQLENMAAKVSGDSIKVTVAAEWDFPVYEAVVRHAHKFKADLIVADQHPGKHTAAGLLHLTDWELLRLSPVPVLLVKTSGSYRRPVILAALDPRHTFSKPAKLDQRILAASATFAEALHGTQHVLHAYVPFPIAAGPETMVNQENIRQLQEEATAGAQKALDGELRASRIPKARRHLVADILRTPLRRRRVRFTARSW